MPQSPTHYLPIAVVDHHTAPPPPDIIALELYLVACPSRPLDIGTYVHVYHVPEPDACSYFPTALSPRPLRIATCLRGRLVGACLNPGNKIVFEMETWNDESQIRLAHLHVDAYPGLTVDRGRWCSLAVAQLRRRLFGSGCKCQENLSAKKLDDILMNDLISTDVEEKWDGTYQVWATEGHDGEARGGELDSLLLEPLLPPGEGHPAAQ